MASSPTSEAARESEHMEYEVDAQAAETGQLELGLPIPDLESLDSQVDLAEGDPRIVDAATKSSDSEPNAR